MASKPTRSQRFTGWLFRNHRWFGILPCVFVIMWGASGVLHPIMSRLSPQAAAMFPPQSVVALHEALSPADVLQKHGIQEVSGLRVIEIEAVSYYQATTSTSPAPSPLVGEGGPVNVPNNTGISYVPVGQGEGHLVRRYFNVTTGDELIDGDVQYAQLLARHFTGDTKSAIARTTLVTQFTDDYLSVNRLLPVYRVDFARDDDLRIYVETSPGRAAALVDSTKATLGAVFLWMHTWSFMGELDVPRKIVITVLLASTLVGALSGAWIYGFMHKRKTLSSSHAPVRRWHRGIAIGVALSTVLFVVSAVWHLFGSEPRDVPAQVATRMQSTSLLLPDAIKHGSWSSVNAVQLNGRTYYQVAEASKVSSVSAAMGEHAEHEAPTRRREGGAALATLYVDVASGEATGDIAREHAISLANQYSDYSGASVIDATPVFSFEGEYGFINKRLPVWRVRYATPDHVAYYVETGSGALAAVVRDADRAEGYSFSFLHKYHWLDFAGKSVRDVVSALFALGVVLVAALGLWMFTRRYVKAAQ